MAAKDRIKKYRESGGAADLVRVEVLVPKAKRDEIVNQAADLRERHRLEKRLADFIQVATERYGLRVFDNIDISKLDDLTRKARVVANALMERGDARAFSMGRKMATELGELV
ncbi:hypothetical protein ABIE78_002703 [Sinorhizobium fredii]|uniref:Uncharacterized protein n=1 Tax=Sinorhizobium fredii (strain USDA 257) TaxID=1185652 RepID=I3X6G0_SINF2|nr:MULTISPECIES: hypothetical protein [Sinorhizobium]AFL51466.1 hypothetical protein USDA257_c28950 [Sinorhizobium fredii USDA 257]PDT81755.1 hypothetical protein CO676_21020 [Sinorhizobium sp. BJ1]